MNAEHLAGGHRSAAASLGQGAIVLHGISKRFGSNLVFDNVRPGIGTGEVVVLMGANGASKWIPELRWQRIHRRSE